VETSRYGYSNKLAIKRQLLPEPTLQRVSTLFQKQLPASSGVQNNGSFLSANPSIHGPFGQNLNENLEGNADLTK
jgi:hypothetical protein